MLSINKIGCLCRKICYMVITVPRRLRFGGVSSYWVSRYYQEEAIFFIRPAILYRTWPLTWHTLLVCPSNVLATQGMHQAEDQRTLLVCTWLLCRASAGINTDVFPRGASHRNSDQSLRTWESGKVSINNVKLCSASHWETVAPSGWQYSALEDSRLGEPRNIIWN